MNRWMIATALLLLVLLFAFYNVAFSSMSLTSPPMNSFVEPHWLYIGAMVAQPTLLAIWAMLSAGPIIDRFPRGLFLVGLVAITSIWGVWRNRGGGLEPYDIGLFLFPLLQFAMMTAPLALVRWLLGWRIVRPESAHFDVDQSSHQFSIAHLLLWMSMAAILLAAATPLLRDTDLVASIDRLPGELGSSLLGSFAYLIVALPVLFVVKATLEMEITSRSVIVATAVVVVEAGVIFNIPLLLGAPYDSASKPFVVCLGSFYAWSLGVLVILRQLGFRLLWTGTSFANIESYLFKLTHPRVRFVVVVVAMLLLFAAMIPSAIALESRRRNHVVDLELRKAGLVPEQSDAGLRINFRQRPVTDELLEKIAELNELKQLMLNGLDITDERLRKICEIKSLEILWLDSTPVTDAGLEHLTRLPNLRRLVVSGPNMTKSGIASLRERLPNVVFDR